MDETITTWKKFMFKNIYKQLYEIWKSNDSIEEKISESHNFSISNLLRELQIEFFSDMCIFNSPQEGYYVIHKILDDEITKTYKIEEKKLTNFKQFFNFLKDIQSFIESKCDESKCKYNWIFQKKPYYIYNNLKIIIIKSKK